MSLYLRNSFSVIDMFNGSLAGGIGVGASSGLYYNPAACLLIGAISGVICILGKIFLI
jgi:ammonia channel protein AmtB